jgi:hypothetical protein
MDGAWLLTDLNNDMRIYPGALMSEEYCKFNKLQHKVSIL